MTLRDINNMPLFQSASKGCRPVKKRFFLQARHLKFIICSNTILSAVDDRHEICPNVTLTTAVQMSHKRTEDREKVML